jgi:hypothetical protein
MKTPRLTLVILVLSLIIVAGSIAQGATTNARSITRVHFWQGHAGVLVQQEHMINPDGCSRVDHYMLRQEHPLFREMYAVLLAAHMAGQPLKLGLAGCYDNFPSIVHLYSER